MPWDSGSVFRRQEAHGYAHVPSLPEDDCLVEVIWSWIAVRVEFATVPWAPSTGLQVIEDHGDQSMFGQGVGEFQPEGSRTFHLLVGHPEHGSTSGRPYELWTNDLAWRYQGLADSDGGCFRQFFQVHPFIMPAAFRRKSPESLTNSYLVTSKEA